LSLLAAGTSDGPASLMICRTPCGSLPSNLTTCVSEKLVVYRLELESNAQPPARSPDPSADDAQLIVSLKMPLWSYTLYELLLIETITSPADQALACRRTYPPKRSITGRAATAVRR